ncbi:hypothetical protein P3S67_021688 [Capsicum chacoense]
MYTTVEQLNLVIHSQAIFWHKPDHGWVKLNVDGCSKGNPGPAVGGGIIRDHAGVMISTFVEFYGECSNNLAEAKAIELKKPPWQLIKIMDLIKNRNFIFCHTLREGDNTADILANLGEDTKTLSVFNEIVSILANIRSLNEADGIPNFRISRKKNKYVTNATR